MPIRSESQLESLLVDTDKCPGGCYVLDKKDIDNCIFISVPTNVTRTIAQELHDILAENFPENKIVIVSENINFLRLELIK